MVALRHEFQGFSERQAVFSDGVGAVEGVGQDLFGHREPESFPELRKRHINHPQAVPDGELYFLAGLAVGERPRNGQEFAALVDEALVVDVLEQEPRVVVAVVGQK